MWIVFLGEGPASMRERQFRSDEFLIVPIEDSHPAGIRYFAQSMDVTAEADELRHGCLKLPNDHAFSGGAQAPSAATRGWAAVQRFRG